MKGYKFIPQALKGTSFVNGELPDEEEGAA